MVMWATGWYILTQLSFRWLCVWLADIFWISGLSDGYVCNWVDIFWISCLSDGYVCNWANIFWISCLSDGYVSNWLIYSDPAVFQMALCVTSWYILNKRSFRWLCVQLGWYILNKLSFRWLCVQLADIQPLWPGGSNCWHAQDPTIKVSTFLIVLYFPAELYRREQFNTIKIQ